MHPAFAELWARACAAVANKERKKEQGTRNPSSLGVGDDETKGSVSRFFICSPFRDEGAASKGFKPHMIIFEGPGGLWVEHMWKQCGTLAATSSARVRADETTKPRKSEQ